MVKVKDELERRTKSDRAWEKVIEKLPVLDIIDEIGYFEIDSKQLKKITGEEPRLIAKFDAEDKLPKIFSENKIGILPKSHNSYILGHFSLFQKVEYPETQPIEYVPVESHFSTLNPLNITREPTAILSAFNYGILDKIADSESRKLFMTDFGKEGTPEFDFYIKDTKCAELHRIHVCNPQIEIDGVFESDNNIIIIEAKNGLPSNFIIRQLYFPFRSLSYKADKPIINVFLTFSLGRIHIHTFDFKSIEEYNSISKTGYRQFSFLKAPTKQTFLDVIKYTEISEEPKLPFPQADSMENIMIAAKIIHDNPGINSKELAAVLGMDARQGGYYGNACCYLELVSRDKGVDGIHFNPTSEGKKFIKLKDEMKRLEMVKLISRHRIFKELLLEHINNNEPIELGEAEDLLIDLKLVNPGTTTIKRRAQTTKSWIEWVLYQIQE